MYKIIDAAGDVYTLHQYLREDAYERMVVANADAIFGTAGIYFDIKKRIGTPRRGATIPDGYYLDLTFHDDPKLHLVEIELGTHDAYRHIGEQLLRFGISSETDKYKIKSLLLQDIGGDAVKQEKLAAYLAKSRCGNVNALLDKVIFDSKPAAIIIIDEATDDLTNVLGQLTLATEVIEAQTYVCGEKSLHRFTPFKDDVLADLPEDEDADELDTIVVPAREEGFLEQFINRTQWFAIRISSAMLDKIKFIAAYQVAPVSGITYIAAVEHIEKYKDTGKYIVYFKQGTLQKLNKIGLGKIKGTAPQGPRYTTYKTIMKAKTLDDIWRKLPS